jgi:antitoxin CptB
MINKKTFKKQIIYRSTHRGSKEMDLLLGKFVKKNINFLNESDLFDLDKLISIEDEILQKSYFEKKSSNLLPNNKITKMFKNFKL